MDALLLLFSFRFLEENEKIYGEKKNRVVVVIFVGFANDCVSIKSSYDVYLLIRTGYYHAVTLLLGGFLFL